MVLLNRSGTHDSVAAFEAEQAKIAATPNTEWLHHRAFWAAYIGALITLRLFFFLIGAFVSNSLAWMLTVVIHHSFTFFVLHWVKGSPYDEAQHENLNMTLWEQIDGGVQYTYTRRALTIVPIIVFLFAALYGEFDDIGFATVFGWTFVVLLPKLPTMHLVRVFGINRD